MTSESAGRAPFPNRALGVESPMAVNHKGSELCLAIVARGAR
jgi:hypothetical protein